jgi:glyoxylate reductase
MKVYITRDIPEAAYNLLKKNKIKFEVYKEDKPIPPELLIKKVKDADGVISLLTDKFDKHIIDEMKRCKVIANYAVGYNNIDVKYAAEKNIIVTNTPDVLTDATADLAITLVLTCARRVHEGEKIMRSGKFKGWKPKMLLGIELKDKIFGIIGAGRIGSAAAIRAAAFGCRIVYFNDLKNENLEIKTGAKKVSLNYLLKNSDFISIHLPLTDKTFHLLDTEKLKLLKKKAILINTARGEIVDEKILIKLLKQKKIFAAGFDVYEGEPAVNPELFELENVVLLPHLGSATEDARNKMAELAAKNVIAILKGKKAVTPVNI